MIALLRCLLAQGLDAVSMAQVANLAGGLVCEKPGVVPIDLPPCWQRSAAFPFKHDPHDIRERVNVFLHPRREAVLERFRTLNVFVTLLAFGSLIAYYGFPLDSDIADNLIAVIKAQLCLLHPPFPGPLVSLIFTH